MLVRARTSCHMCMLMEVRRFSTLYSLVPIDVFRQVGDLYRILFDAIVSGKQPASGRNGFYFLESGEFKQLAVAETIARALYARGKVVSPEAIQLSEADLDPESCKFALVELGINARARSERSRQLGWNPLQMTEDFYASIPVDVDYSLKTH